MKGAHILMLSLVGIGTFFGLAGAFYSIFPGFADDRVTTSIAAITIGAAVALLFFGVMLGVYHGSASQRHKLDKDLKRKFVNALSFERKDRARLEKELHKTKKVVVNLEDQLARFGFGIKGTATTLLYCIRRAAAPSRGAAASARGDGKAHRAFRRAESRVDQAKGAPRGFDDRVVPCPNRGRAEQGRA